MSGGALSLEKSVRTCDVNVGEAIRIRSDRFFNPQNMVCIPWNGINNKGQNVCPDSFYTKTAGCNSAQDRVTVENALRPNYMSYVTLGAEGIRGDVYGNPEAEQQSLSRKNYIDSRNDITGNFGVDFGAKVQNQSCSIGAYERGMSQMAQSARNQTYLQNGSIANNYKSCGGN
jgi:hypothetical protein